MPNAIAGDGDSTGYSFTIQATPKEAQAFYTVKLPQLGWNLFATGQGANAGTIMLMFMKGIDTASVTIIPQKDNLLYVLLVKS